ncbi:MAG TPA: formylglycine-generating enzyme family protein [Candidatus Eremiobacteraeota bacterium]|nr:MAG: Serine/threonine-protein kinase pkn1 [bacterium ADurb.Bin363]HPZ08676.1 formylglycine-generating enzyme family protein [Candidatus Eremiobacteraeota bacterium]
MKLSLKILPVVIFLIIITLSGLVKSLAGSVTLPETREYRETEMILIPAGDFWMGSQTKQGELDEYPQHKVYLKDYYIDKYEVTNSQYCKFLNEKGNHRAKDKTWWLVIQDQNCLIEVKNGIYIPKTGADNYPVVSVTWHGAKTYAEWMGKGLPTEAQWEKAAKSTRGNIYPWGMEWDANRCNNKNMNDETLCKKMINFYDGRGVLPAGSFPGGASNYAVMDMAGNVAEWCYDWYDENYYKTSPYKNPTGPKTGKYKVIRGGSWENIEEKNFRCSDRSIIDSDRGSGIGFRCILDPEKR